MDLSSAVGSSHRIDHPDHCPSPLTLAPLPGHDTPTRRLELRLVQPRKDLARTRSSALPCPTILTCVGQQLVERKATKDAANHFAIHFEVELRPTSRETNSLA